MKINWYIQLRKLNKMGCLLKVNTGTSSNPRPKQYHPLKLTIVNEELSLTIANKTTIFIDITIVSQNNHFKNDHF